jgi:hypothetical protein
MRASLGVRSMKYIKDPLRSSGLNAKERGIKTNSPRSFKFTTTIRKDRRVSLIKFYFFGCLFLEVPRALEMKAKKGRLDRAPDTITT